MALRCLPSRCRSIARLLSSTQVEPCYDAIKRVVGRTSSWPTGVIHGYATDARSAATTLSWKTSMPCGQDFIRRFRGTTVAAGELITVAVPPMGDSVSEGAIASVEKKPGDVVREDEIIAQIETDKVTIDVKYPFPKPGVVKEILVRVEDVVVVGDAVATVEEGAEVDADASPDAASATDLPPAGAPPPKETSPPAEAKPAAAAPQAAEPAAEQAKAAASGKRSERRVKMTRLRKRVAERLKGAQNTYAMLSTFNEIDMTELMAMRNLYKDTFLEQHGVKLGFMSAFIKAATSALQHVPAVNAVIDEDEILYRDYVDISIAVATPKGLVVPVLRDVDTMSFADVERKMVELGRKARDGTISIDEMAGGTFTVSNGGVFGSMLSTPIINPPQSAILGMHATNMRPMVVDGKVEPRPMMYVALTYDHRLIDGREAVTFLKRVKEVVEDPRRLLLDV